MIYPYKTSLIPAFFKLFAAITAATKPQALNVLAAQVQQYADGHASLQDDFASKGTDAPSDAQADLYAAEASMLLILREIMNRKLADFKQQTLHQPCTVDLDALSQLQSDTPSANSLALLIQVVMSIGAEILTFDSRCNTDNDNESYQIISHAMGIMDGICLQRQAVTRLQYEPNAIISLQDFKQMGYIVVVMCHDHFPENDFSKFGLYFVKIFISKLLVLRDAIETRYGRTMIAQPTDDTLSNEGFIKEKILSSQLKMIDSILRRLNLEHLPDFRHKYDVQSKKYNIKKGNLDIEYWGDNLNIDNLYDILIVEVKQLHNKSQHIQSIDFCFSLLEARNCNEKDKNQIIRMQWLRELLFQVRLVLQLCMMLPCSKRGMESDEEQTHQIKNYTHLQSVLCHMVLMLVAAMHSAGDKVLHNDPWKILIHSWIKAMTLDKIDFHEVNNDVVSCAYIEVFNTATALHITDVTDDARALVLSQIPATLITYARNAIDNKHKDLQNFFKTQILLDCFYLSLLQCQTNAEVQSYLTTESLEFITAQLAEMARYNALTKAAKRDCTTVYTIIHRMICKARQLEISPSNIDVTFFTYFNAEEITELLTDIKTQIANLEKTAWRISTPLAVFFLQNTSMFLKCVTTSANLREAATAQILSNILESFLDRLFMTTKPIYAELRKKNLLTEQPLMLRNNANSFAPDLPPVREKSAKPLGKTKLRKKSVAPRVNRSVFDVFAAYEYNAGLYSDNPKELLRLYESQLIIRDKKKSLYALLGLAEHLSKSDNIAANTVLAGRLLTMEADLFIQAKSLIAESLLNDLQLQFKKFMSSYMTADVIEPIASLAPLVAAPKFASVIKKKEVKPSLLVKHSMLQPAPALLKLPQLGAVKPIKVNADPFHQIRRLIKLPNIFSSLQQAIFDNLKKQKMTPLIHGGAVTDTLFNIPYRDIDLLVFCSDAALKQFIKTHAEKFHIASFRRNKNSYVYVIKFDSRLVDTGDDELEIAFIPPSGRGLEEDLRDKAREYGINFTLYADESSVIDPLNQYKRIIGHQPTLDVGQVLSIDVNEYFAKWPERTFDCLYKMAKYKKHGHILQMNAYLETAININRIACITLINERISTAKFDKFFLQGFATESFDMLSDERFRFMIDIFPGVTPANIVLVRAACQLVDREILNDEYKTMTTAKREQLRAVFISAALAPDFMQQHDNDDFHQDRTSFDKACVLHIQRCRFEVTDELINRVQALWWDTINCAMEPRLINCH